MSTTLGCANAVVGGDVGSSSPDAGNGARRDGGALAADAFGPLKDPTFTLPEGGEVLLDGVTPADKASFDGAATPAAAPVIVYPLAGTLIPSNVVPIEVHLKRSRPTQTLARLSFHVDGGFDFVVYGACAPAELDPTGCVVTLPQAVCAKLGRAGDVGPISATVRLAAPGGSDVGETAFDRLDFTSSALAGGIYYWSSVPDPSDPKNAFKNRTMIRRYDFVNGEGTPDVYWQTAIDSPPVAMYNDPANPSSGMYQQPHGCVGCHAISQDGTKIALTFGGSLSSTFALVDVAKKTPIASRTTDPAGFATMTTFSPAGDRVVQTFRGKLVLRTTDAAMTTVNAALFASSIPEALTEPFWSPAGSLLAFTSWIADPAQKVITGDLVAGAQIWAASSDGKDITGEPRVLVPRAIGKTRHYPAISHDGAFVAYNESTCGGPRTNNGWGDDPCDGYNDPSARVWLVGATGGAPIELARLNGPGTWTNSWPRFAPDGGLHRGRKIYWAAFSSRRPYGLRLAGSSDDSAKPQLWFAAISELPEGGGDPSYAPVWLPNQNDDMRAPAGNHVPQWVVRIVGVE